MKQNKDKQAKKQKQKRYFTFLYKEKFEDIRGVIRSRKSMKESQQNGKNKKDNMTNNDLQNTTQKTKDPATRARGGLRCSGKVSSSCLTSDTR